MLTWFELQLWALLEDGAPGLESSSLQAWLAGWDLLARGGLGSSRLQAWQAGRDRLDGGWWIGRLVIGGWWMCDWLMVERWMMMLMLCL